MEASLPICNRWDYAITTASYGFVHKRGQSGWESETEKTGKVWSRVRIFFPTSSYMSRLEQQAYPVYVAMCSVGTACGIYLGLSMIGFIQLAVYGIFICYAAIQKHRETNGVDGIRLPIGQNNRISPVQMVSK